MFKFFSQALMRSRNLRENGKYLPEEVCDTKVHVWVFCSINIIYSRTYIILSILINITFQHDRVLRPDDISSMTRQKGILKHRIGKDQSRIQFQVSAGSYNYRLGSFMYVNSFVRGMGSFGISC